MPLRAASCGGPAPDAAAAPASQLRSQSSAYPQQAQSGGSGAPEGTRRAPSTFL